MSTFIEINECRGGMRAHFVEAFEKSTNNLFKKGKKKEKTQYKVTTRAFIECSLLKSL